MANPRKNLPAKYGHFYHRKIYTNKVKDKIKLTPKGNNTTPANNSISDQQSSKPIVVAFSLKFDFKVTGFDPWPVCKTEVHLKHKMLSFSVRKEIGSFWKLFPCSK